MMRKKAKSVLAGVMWMASLLCFAGAVCVLSICLGEPAAGGGRAWLSEDRRGLLLIAYVMASVGVALCIVLARMARATNAAGAGHAAQDDSPGGSGSEGAPST